MNELTQLERAQNIANSFVPTESSEGCYTYVFLGEATWDATSYEELDGQCLMSRRIWHVDETKTDCVCYAGQGANGRINQEYNHSIFPSPHLRLKLRSDLSETDSIELERLLIQELGCICDADRDDGCLVNIRYHQNGPFCCPALEAAAYKYAQALHKGNAAAVLVLAVDVIAMTQDKQIVSRGSARGLARELGIQNAHITACCRHKERGIWQSSEKRALYFCYADDYETYEINPMTNKCLQKERLLIIAKLDGSDIFCGTASEAAAYAPEIKCTGDLHRVAKGKCKSAYGYTARYADEIADELKAPVAACGPNLSAFF